MERSLKVNMDMRALAEYAKQHYGLPPDAMYQGCEYNPKTDRVSIQFKHQKFDMVKEPPVIEEKNSGDSAPEGEEKMTKDKKKK